MEGLLVNPAVQGGVAPFILAFVSALVLVRIAKLYGLAIAIGLLTMVMLTTGIQFEPLTSTRKIVLVALLAPVLALAFEFLRLNSRFVRFLGIFIGIGSVVWLLWPYLLRQEILQILIVAGGLGVFGAWMSASFMALRKESSLAAAASISAMGFGLGGSALLGASAFLGQMGIAIGVSALAVISSLLVSRSDQNATYIETFVAGVLFALIGSAAVIYAKMAWYVLVVLSAIPILARIGLSKDQAPWLRAVIWFGLCMVPAFVAIGLSFKAEGPVPY